MFKGKRDLVINSVKERMELQKDNHQGAFIANIRGFDIYIKSNVTFSADVIFYSVIPKSFIIDKELGFNIESADVGQNVVINSYININEAVEYVADFIIENSFKI